MVIESQVNGKGVALANGTAGSADECCAACTALGPQCNTFTYCEDWQGERAGPSAAPLAWELGSLA